MAGAMPTAVTCLSACHCKLACLVLQGKCCHHASTLLLLLPACKHVLFLMTSHRFQAQLPDHKKYTRVFPTLLTIWREEGPRALYKGFVPKALRLGIGQSVGLVTFQQLLRAFGVQTPKDPAEPEYIPVPWE